MSTASEGLRRFRRSVLDYGERDVIRSHFADQARIADLKQQLWLVLGDVKARVVSCSCHPPLTQHERYHIERAEALLAGYEPAT